MLHTEEHIVNTYSELFEGLSPISKIKLIESLAKSLTVEKEDNEKNFYKSFGAFASNKTAKEIITDIRSSRKFRKKEIKL